MIHRSKDWRQSVPSSDLPGRSFHERFRSRIKVASPSASITNAAGFGQPKPNARTRPLSNPKHDTSPQGDQMSTQPPSLHHKLIVLPAGKTTGDLVAERHDIV